MSLEGEGEASNAYNDPTRGVSITQASLFGVEEEKRSANPADVLEKVLSSGLMRETARRSESTENIPPPIAEGAPDPREYIKTAQVPRRFYGDVHPITEEEIREALKKEVAKHGSWKKGAIKKMSIDDITCQTALHYTLETFTETRAACSGTEPVTINHYMSSVTGGGSAFATGDPWDVVCEASATFVEETKTTELPGTSTLTACQSCGSEGVSHCFHCRGFGTDRCSYCRGTGMKSGIPHPAVVTHPMVATMPHGQGDRGYAGTSLATVNKPGGHTYGMGTPVHFLNQTGVPPPGIGHHDLCYFCHGTGIKQCANCKGQGKKSCNVCGGSGNVRTFTKLKIKFGVERSEFYYDEGGVPEKFLRSVTGEVILSEANPLVLPLSKYPIDEVNDQSKRLLQIQINKCLGSSRILQQRQQLEAVPVARVTYTLGADSGVFWVYGQERRCYVPRYPAKCSIL